MTRKEERQLLKDILALDKMEFDAVERLPSGYTLERVERSERLMYIIAKEATTFVFDYKSGIIFGYSYYDFKPDTFTFYHLTHYTRILNEPRPGDSAYAIVPKNLILAIEIVRYYLNEPIDRAVLVKNIRKLHLEISLKK